METLLMNCKSHLYKVIRNRLLESIITIHTQYNNIMNKQQIYSTINSSGFVHSLFLQQNNK